MVVSSAIESPLFVLGIVFGASTISVGILLGMLINRRGRQTPRDSNVKQAVEFLRGLFEWTSGMANEVAEYREVVDGVARTISDVDHEQSEADSPLWLGELIEANQKLKHRLEQAEAALKHQSNELAVYVSEASTDPLTNLPNRRVFDRELKRRFAEWRRHGTLFSILLVDIDHFKRFNDRYGHLVGDEVLQEVARVMQAMMRESDLVTRFGGEELAVLLPATGAAEASRAAERIRAAVERATVRHDGRALCITVSCGVAHATVDDTTERLIERADGALYASKHNGRNFAHWHDGRRCIPITERIVETEAALEPVAVGSGERHDEEQFRVVCRDLRKRLIDIAREEENKTD
jgi:diguanylate cyclase (GGDEF)-like protein